MTVSKTSYWTFAVAPLACIAIGACSGGGAAKAPTGQVVATVDGDEVTLRELNAEMAGVVASDPKSRKAAEQVALQAILSRRILAGVAQRQGLDKDPDFTLQRRRALDAVLVQSLEAKLSKDVPPSTREEAVRYIADHPDSFAERKIMTVDQIRTVSPDAAMVEKLRPLKTLEQVEALFDQEHVPYQRLSDRIDALNSDPRIIEAILKVKAEDIFAIPNGSQLLINKIKETRIEPYSGEKAITLAMQRLRQQHTQEAVAREFNRLLKAGESKIQYNSNYRPAATVPVVPAPASGKTGNGV